MKKVSDEKSWFIEWTEQYSQFFVRCNWYTFNFAHIEIENDKIMGGIEVTFILLGLGFRWRWNHTETEKMMFCKDAIKGIEAGTVKTTPLADFIKELEAEGIVREE